MGSSRLRPGAAPVEPRLRRRAEALPASGFDEYRVYERYSNCGRGSDNE